MPGALRIRSGDRVSMSGVTYVHHDRDESAYNPMLPDAVVFVQTTEGVATVARFCFGHEIPLAPYGAGSSLEDHLLTMTGGVSLDLSQVNHALSMHPENLMVMIELGVTHKQLNTGICDAGLFFLIDPGADAFIGGIYATCAPGTNTVRHDTMRENVLNLMMVTADDRIIKAANRAHKSSTGCDLTCPFIGSERTLDIITETTLKLYPQFEAVSAAVYAFPSMGDAVSAVIDIIQMGVPIARVELAGALVIRTISQYDKLTLSELPTLFFEFHGSEHGVQEQVETVQQITTEHKGQGFGWATHPEDRSRLWNTRHSAYFVFLQLEPDYRTVTTDMCVSISYLAECVVEIEKDLLTGTLQLSAPVIGHVGSGNLHVVLLIDPNKSEELREVECINQHIIARAITIGDTYTDEHGVGLHKMDFLVAEHGNDMVDLMCGIKQASGPKHILNPGKILRL